MSNGKSNLNSATSGGKRRWLSIGPGIVIALAVSAFVGSQWAKAGIEQKTTSPIMERRMISSTSDGISGPTPDVGFIIRHARKLHVSKSQAARLQALQTKWVTFYGPRMASANKAVDKTNEYLSEAKGHSRTPVTQIQGAAEPVIAVSGEISSVRCSYWDRAISILSSDQRKMLQAEREADWAARSKGMSLRISSGS